MLTGKPRYGHGMSSPAHEASRRSEDRHRYTIVTRPSSAEGQGAHPPPGLGLDPEQWTRTGALGFPDEIRCRTSVFSSKPPLLQPERHSTLKCAFARGRNTYCSTGECNPCDPIRSTRIITSATRGNSCSNIGAACFRRDSAARSAVVKFSGVALGGGERSLETISHQDTAEVAFPPKEMRQPFQID